MQMYACTYVYIVYIRSEKINNQDADGWPKVIHKKHWYLCYIHACYNDLERSYFSKDLKFILNIDFYLIIYLYI